MRNAFTMVELVFVIVILGILAAIAVPKLAATRDDAIISRAISTIASVRSGIVNERQTRLFRGDSDFISRLDAGVGTGTAGVMIFDNNGTATSEILTYGVVTSTDNGGWVKTSGNNGVSSVYTFRFNGVSVPFTYTVATGRFDCNRNTAGAVGQLCRDLTD